MRGTVTAEDGAFIVELQLKDPDGKDLGERRLRFDDKDCGALEEPTVLLLGMMITAASPHAVTSAVERAVPTAMEPAPDPPIPPSNAGPPASERPARRRRAPPRELPSVPMTLGVGAVTSVGFLPNVGLGGAVRWTAAFSAVLLGVEGGFETSWAVRVQGSDATFRFLNAGVFAGLSVLRSSAVELILPVGAQGGVVWASTTGLRVANDTMRIVAVVAAGALVRVALGPTLHFEALPDVRVPFIRDAFALRQGEQLIRIHETAPVEGRLMLGVGWRFH